MTKKLATDAELAAEARRWVAGELTPKGWEDAPNAVPHAQESVPISLRVPAPMLAILKEFARREGVGYQVLMKRWLDERICSERDRRRKRAAKPTVPSAS
jgi:predicted DNA binding CopG/RHH family protein